MNFTSQICTTRDQSKQLLALGLKKETADICIRPDNTLIIIRENSFIYHNLENAVQEEYLPAWSLHRLIEICDIVNFTDWDIIDTYDKVIDLIEHLIKTEGFNKEYLDE